MSSKKQTGETPANQQKGKKQCTCCHIEKKLTDFYISYSPLYSIDKRVPICKECCKTLSINADGSFNEEKLKDTLRKIDKPLYYDLIYSAQQSVKKENSYISEDEVRLHGHDVISKYFTLIAMRQDRAKSYSDSEQDGFMHQNNNRTISEKQEIKKNVQQDKDVQSIKHYSDIGEFDVTDEIKDLFGDGYQTIEYKKMKEKYDKLTQNYILQTNLHQEALATYVRFKVKEEIATAKGDVIDAKKWYDAAVDAADKAKLTPKQLTKADLQKGLNSFSEISQALEQTVDIIQILPRFKNQPNDSVDFNIWCYINYARKLKGLPTVSYEEVYKFYDDMRDEYIAQYGDPYGIFEGDTTLKNRENVKKFIILPADYDTDDSGGDED